MSNLGSVDVGYFTQQHFFFPSPKSLDDVCVIHDSVFKILAILFTDPGLDHHSNQVPLL